MTTAGGRVIPIFLEEEMESSYLDYSMSVIISRALPDVRDGLKPSQRRILVAMNDLNLQPGAAHRKCAKIAGDTSGNYHPHGEQVVYPTLVRLAQEFVMRYRLVDGQGNFGCFTGDTRVKLLDGTEKSFAELAALGPEATFAVYSVDRSGRIVAGRGGNARVTRRDAALVEVELDNGERLRCTPDHRFLLRDNTYKEARDLTADDSLMAGYFDTGALHPAAMAQEAASFHNHRIVAVRSLAETAAVYDITVDEHHNFLLSAGVFVHNSVDGDPPAAMRYTEARLAGPAAELLADMDRDTVDFVANYDGTREEPVILPGMFPNLVCNGSSGIAVGMATNIPPHNLREVGAAVQALLDDPQLGDDEVLRLVPGPDFPTGGVICGRGRVAEATRTGRGLLVVRARAEIEVDRDERQRIVVTEIPFQTNKSMLLERIADLVRDGRLSGVSDLRDESDRDGLRIVIDLKRDANATLVLNQLYKHSPLQETFGVNNLVLVDGVPRTLALRELLLEYIRHRENVVVRRARYDLAVAEKRAHILEGLRIALDHLDEVVALIRASRDVPAAREGLMTRFGLSEEQANAILDMRLQRLTALEREKLDDEYADLLKLIENLRGILASPARVRAIVKEEIQRLVEKYGDARRTEITDEDVEFVAEDLIAEEDNVISISHLGYVKRLPVTIYRRQRRGGRGITGMSTRQEDFVEQLFVASTHNYLLFLTNFGRCYWQKVHALPEAGRQARGKALVNVLRLQGGERVTAVVPVADFEESGRYVLMATARGLVKKTPLAEYARPRPSGIRAIDLQEGDNLIDARLTRGDQEIILAKRSGLSIRFSEKDVRPMGRVARGVRGTRLEGPNDRVVGMVVVGGEGTILVVTERGFGKRSRLEDYPRRGRGGLGVITVKNTPRNGPLVSIHQVSDDEEVMIMTRNGVLIRLPVKDVSVIGRNTQGVKMVNLDEGDAVADVARLATAVGPEQNGDEGGPAGPPEPSEAAAEVDAADSEA